ncbi:winged helix DNA-binding protein [Alkalibaculum sp. M08DMB]|uniref:Winged helix DNA-binding protein n=1 Tax=Alkalibaculum sporogenes TaxID=2655001 RepID=A0A6A7K7S8_9FIRM|nr:MarR family transcriptional regulator [Alkalibaculum sporogenes]MPW25464.1 winged helix DNA-binding protein [Alkalibaculum sporogenes]
MTNTIEEQLMQLNQFYKENEEIYHGLATYFGLSDSSLWLLYSLHEATVPYTQAEICSTWSISKQTIHSALKGLETGGYIQMEYSIQNRKSKQIILTSAGKILVQKTVGRIVEAEKLALCGLSDDERILLVSLSQRHLECLKREMKQITESDILSDDL